MTSLAHARDFLLDLLFPQWCVICEKEGENLCESCQAALPQIPIPPSCPSCARACPGAFFCLSCAKQVGMRRLWCIGPFAARILRESIHTLKYDGVEDLAQPLGQELGRRIARSYIGPAPLVLPIPLHWRRRNARGFNQSERLASSLAPLVGGVVVSDMLKRKRATTPQVDVDHNARAENIRGVFALHTNARQWLKKPVVLVDDVWTTGSTMSEAARVLGGAGFQEIYGAVVARG